MTAHFVPIPIFSFVNICKFLDYDLLEKDPSFFVQLFPLSLRPYYNKLATVELSKMPMLDAFSLISI